MHKTVAFPHNGLDVIINKDRVIGEGCVINANVVLGSGYLHDGAFTLDKNV